MEKSVSVVGAGLAGSECALQLAARGVHVVLYEMRPLVKSPAHHTDLCAELVCSNSLKSQNPTSCAGLLKEELTLMGSVLIKTARECEVSAGGALAVDREKFSQKVTQLINENPYISRVTQEVTQIPQGPVVICAGPLCSEALSQDIQAKLGASSLSFYDAAAPIVDAQTIDYETVFAQSRYEELGAGDYLNCPMTREEYLAFYEELVAAPCVIAKDFEQKELFQACQPVEEVAKTGVDSLRFGALKPVGLIDPRTGKRPWACVQLRAENEAATSYNLVGFQTNLLWGEQKRIFRMIPGLKDAEFFRYGVMHKNTFIDSPRSLDKTFALPHRGVRFAGQITGTEGYCEAMASGLLAALQTYAELCEMPALELPHTGAFGSLVAYATDPYTSPFQPMHVNYGLFVPLNSPIKNKKERYAAYAARAQQDLKTYIQKHHDIFYGSLIHKA